MLPAFLSTKGENPSQGRNWLTEMPYLVVTDLGNSFASDMAQWVKMLVASSSELEFDPWDLQDKRREHTSGCFLLIFTYTMV